MEEARFMSKKVPKKEQWPAEEQFLSTADIAEKLSVARSTIYGWVYKGKLKGVKVGKLLRIPRSEIDRLVQWRD